ncbi:MFS general substrate transporter [Rhizodiscina lignyota]|uniref:MFS general substrate transporter n=1 Tax=Rhizodiscina lignyota TaxID=1504668 RepID=A0A9P4IK35_9PEZI|nr:MFS general substrate transporter [Rhizodiscina lignyota]
MSYGILQEYFSNNWPLKGSNSAAGVIGTTSNGVIYIAMPFLFGLFSQPGRARFRQAVALGGLALCALSFLLSSFSVYLWHVIATQSVLASLGGALIYSPTTLSLGECFNTGNRATAYAIVLSFKASVGSTCPFLIRFLLDKYGFRLTMRVWAAIVAGSGLCGILLIPVDTSRESIIDSSRRRRTAWHFLKHRTFYIYSIATILQSSGYGIPPTYIISYARSTVSMSQMTTTLLLTLFNIPGILASNVFGYLSDNKRYPLSATSTTLISSLSSALAILLLWGFASRNNMALLLCFSIIFGFFSSAYSATWGGMIKEMEHEAVQRNEALDPGLVYGLLNGARGVGYVSGGLASVPLLKTGANMSGTGRFGYATEYGPLIIFTGLVSSFGGWSLVWKCYKMFR